jgi:Uma2 family endonuclease
MSASAIEASDLGLPEYMTWEELDDLTGDIAKDIELWDRKVIWNRRGPTEHQQFQVRMRNAIEADARRAMQQPTDSGETPCWVVTIETNVFFTEDKNSYLTPDFLVRRCLPRGSDTTAADVVLVGEVLSGSDTAKRRQWKMDRYAAAGIPWYWEVELDSGRSWDISKISAYELVTVPATDLKVKLLRPAMYGLAGEWEPGDVAIEFPEPFSIYISWEDLAF